LGALVEQNLHKAADALKNRDPKMAEEAIGADAEVDHMEIEVEEDCLKILALHQPVAADLRFIVAVFKINNDLERIGDQAVNIANKVVRLCEQPEMPITFDFAAMATKVSHMLQNALDALVNLDADQARQVCAEDDKVDDMKREVRGQVHEQIGLTPKRVQPLLDLLGIARNLERIADLATNISEDVIYMIDGKIIRHHEEQ
ncbi:MAG: phosphate signaling complex protein PhoU, partial [Planctomycetota bacterium]